VSRGRRARVPPARRPRVLVLVPEPREGATAAERIALTVCNSATLTGRCICGATPEGVQELAPGTYRAVFRHEDDCPAISAAAHRAVGL
jgi:hypothetical protein